MADDEIDIEEHDVLDNPVIRRIFPDITIIKKEISQYYEDVPDIKQEPEINTTFKKPIADQILPLSVDECVRNVHKSSDFVNKTQVHKPYQRNKIILGTKPKSTLKETKDGKSHIDTESTKKSAVRIPKVVLQDIGAYIYRNDRYCKDCLILFPSTSELSDHERNAHCMKTRKNCVNVVVALEKTSEHNRNECTFCGSYFSSSSNLVRHYKNVHKKKVNFKATSKRNKAVSKANVSRKSSIIKVKRSRIKNIKSNSKNVCFHCKKHFPDHKTLIEHIYQVLEPKRDSNVKLRKKATPHKQIVATDELRTEKQTRTKLREKLTFENQDLDTSGSESFEDENYDSDKELNTKVTKKKNDKTFTTNRLTRELTKKKISNDENQDFEASESESLEVENDDSDKEINTKVTEKKNDKTFTTNRLTRELTKKKVSNHQNQDFEVSESESLEVENDDIDKEINTKVTQKKDHKTITTNRLAREHTTKMISNDENQDLDPCSSRTLRSKRRYENRDLDKSELQSLTTRENSENQLEPSLKRRKKHEIDHLDKSKFISLRSKQTSKNQNSLKPKTLNTKLKIKNPDLAKPASKLTKTKGLKVNNQDSSSSSKNYTIKKKTQSNKTDSDDLKDNFVYECVYCTYMLSTARAYYRHIVGKHKVENILRANKVVFNKQCKYCPSECINETAHNKHVYSYHYDLMCKHFPNETIKSECRNVKPSRLKNPAFRMFESFVLESIIYKCNKCDIHFLSSCIAKDHDKHMELLIHWKCSICWRIFKKHDKHLHLKQHTFSKTLNVCQFNESELSRLLYNCTKCAIHFTEERYLEHYSKCDEETRNSVYCKICDILVDKYGYESHESHHRMGNHTVDFTVIVADIIAVTNNKEIIKKRKRLYEQVNCLTFCPTCKCYLTDMGLTRKAHVESRCSEITKYTCNMCGLVLTNKAIGTHREHHRKEIGLRLQDYKFFDLNGIQINPLIPEYPQCNNCEVNFVSRNDVKSHICSEIESLTCSVCDIKLSENAYKLHMNFHSYSMSNANKGTLQSDTNVISESEAVAVVNPASRTVVVVEPEPQAVAVLNSESEAVKDITSDCTVRSINLESQSVKITTSESQIDPNDNPESQAISALTSESTKSEIKPDTHSITNSSSNSIVECLLNDYITEEKSNNIFVYLCQSCKIAVDMYDKVIEHCQNHFNPVSILPSSLKICAKCSLKFESHTYENHQKLHFHYKTIPLLTFDPFYFTSDNKTWIQHIFSSVPPSVHKEVVCESIYQFECRLKMEVLQKGPSFLTVYKCDKCGAFIDPDCLLTHVKDVCPKNVKKHPCSKCGLPFLSSAFRSKHEKIHRRYDSVRIKSYNIVLINREADNSYIANFINAKKPYVLYQCRTCDGVVDKLQRNIHKCNVDDLRKCDVCKLLLYKDDFDGHVLRHSNLAGFNIKSIKVILFGKKEESVKNKSLSPSFEGLIYDYTLYKCTKCEICENNKISISKHVCTLDDSKWKCPKCGFYICASRSLKQHIKMHDSNTEFKTENINVVNFDLTNEHDLKMTQETRRFEDKNEFRKESEQESNADSVTAETNVERIVTKPNDVLRDKNVVAEQESVALYKCACGLHFMDILNAKNHSKLCNPNIKDIRQSCSKCSLVFNPTELFSHLIAHHGDKNKTHKYNIIEHTDNEDTLPAM